MRLLYLMHVDWHWIRQRPHEVAERLAASGHDVSVLYVPDLRFRRARGELTSPVSHRALPTLPYRRFAPIGAAAHLAQRLMVERILRRTPFDAVWLTSPTLLPLVRRVDREAIVYDCMDLAAGFAADPRSRRLVEAQESEVCAKAQLIFCSSDYLTRHVRSTHGRDAILVRNGIDTRRLGLAEDPSPKDPDRPVHMFYAGTISHWFDFALCLEVLDRRPAVEIWLAGPREVPIPSHPRLVYLGVIPQHDLPALANRADVLIMPFTVTPLIEGVDPVKLYEYIAWRRPVIAVRYPELDHFKDLIHTYAGLTEFLALLDGAEAQPADLLPSREKAEVLLTDSDWDGRVAVMERALARTSKRASNGRTGGVATLRSVAITPAMYRFRHHVTARLGFLKVVPGAKFIAHRIDSALARKPLRVRLSDRIIWVDPRDEAIARGVLLDGAWQDAETRLIERYVQAGDVVVDVGANIGYFTSLAAKLVESTGVVYGVEPDPHNFALLSRTIQENDFAADVRLVNAAAGETAGRLTLHRDARNFGNHTFAHSNVVSRGDSISVPVITLDELLDERETRRVSFVKLDVQGWEAHVLRGASRLLATAPYVLLEFWPKGLQAAGTDPAHLLDELFAAGSVALVQGESAEPVTREQVLQACAAAPGEQVDLLVKYS